MSLAETAVLAVALKLEGLAGFTGGIAEADAASASLGKTAASTGNILGGSASNFSLVKQAASGLGAELGAMGSHLKGVLTGPLGLLGLGAGLFTIGGLLKAGTEEASTFGLEVAKLSALTGQSVEATSAMAAALDHFGISGDAAIRTVGMLTKNIGNIVNSKGGVAGFAQTFNLSLTDAKGNLVDVNEEILRTADYFNNKSIPATEKAAALAKLYGRSWQTLIPFLTAGRQGILDAEQAAKDLGLTLTQQNVGDLAKYRENFLTLGDAVKGLQLQLGLVLIPAISDVAKSITDFLRSGGRDKLVSFFKDVVQSAKEFGSFVTGTVIPTLSGLASAAQGFWNMIPAPLRDILVKGFVADRTIHFLLGVSPLNLAKNLIGDIAGPILARIGGGLLGGFLQRGGSPATPLWVASVNGGLPGGGGGLPGDIAGAAGGVGGLSAAAFAQFVALAAVPLIPLVATYFLAGGATGIAKSDLAGRTATATARGLNPANVPTSGGLIDPTRNRIADWYASVKKLDGDVETMRNAIAAGLDGLNPKTPAQASTILKIAASRDKETSQAITVEKLKQSVKQGIGPDIEKLRGVIAAKLDADTRAARAAGQLAAGAIRDKDLSVNLTNRTVVNVSALSVAHVVTVTNRAGWTAGTRQNNATFGRAGQ